MPRTNRIPDFKATSNHFSIVAQIQALVDDRSGSEATFEDRQRASREVIREVLWLAEEMELQALVTTAEMIEVDGKKYRRLEQPSSSTMSGLMGAHLVEEKLYREVGVRNGPTVKPIELRVGAVTRTMLPDLARVAGLLHAHMPSRDVERVLVEMGFAPPSRAFLDGHLRDMGVEIADQIEELEQAARAVEAKRVQPKVASASCGLDRLAVRMDEPLSAERAAANKDLQRHRAEKVYERTPPPPAEYNWRMMWVGSVTIYDAEGNVLKSWRYAIEALADPASLIRRVTADVKEITERHPGIPVVSVQDGARDVASLPAALRRELEGRDLSDLPDDLRDIASNDGVYERTDFHHLMGYLDAVVVACEPDGDPRRMRQWYRNELRMADNAIDRIYQSLLRRRAQLPADSTAADALALDRALSYIKGRRPKMRYATLHANNLTLGSGATESTCALMQLRVKRPGMAWEVPGLRGTIAIRSLVLSERWPEAWAAYRAAARTEVRYAA
jgi:hypothetical protein